MDMKSKSSLPVVVQSISPSKESSAVAKETATSLPVLVQSISPSKESSDVAKEPATDFPKTAATSVSKNQPLSESERKKMADSMDVSKAVSTIQNIAKRKRGRPPGGKTKYTEAKLAHLRKLTQSREDLVAQPPKDAVAEPLVDSTRNTRKAKLICNNKMKKYLESEAAEDPVAKDPVADDQVDDDSYHGNSSDGIESEDPDHDSDTDPEFVFSAKQKRKMGMNVSSQIDNNNLSELFSTVHSEGRSLRSTKNTRISPVKSMFRSQVENPVTIVKADDTLGILALVGGVMECSSEPFDQSYLDTPTP